ncbi:MAG: DUF401 family protein [Bacillota bacterium]|jgi:integral membrane protein (TIGR00529 family)
MQSAIQPIGIALAFATIMLLSIKKVRLSRVMFVASVIMGFTSGLNAKAAWTVLWDSWVDKGTLELAAAVLSIGIFSTVMKELGYLERTVDGLQNLLGNVKAAIMAVPALMGTLPVLGGAALSAPLVDRLGDPLGLAPDTKAAANLVFRHGMFFCFPFSSGLILTSQITGFTIPQLIGRLWPMSLAMWVIGYFTFLRTSQEQREVAAGSTDTARSQLRFTGLATFLRYGSPLLLALLLGLLLKQPLWLALSAGSVLCLALGTLEGKRRPSLKVLYKGANLEQVVAMFWIMAFKGFVTISPVFPELVSKGMAKGVSPSLMALVMPFLFGYGSASQLSTVGVLLPILLPHALSGEAQLTMIALVYSVSFVAYFASPLHLCQVLTCQYFNVEITRVYKRNWPIFAGLMGVVMIYYRSLANLI